MSDPSVASDPDHDAGVEIAGYELRDGWWVRTADADRTKAFFATAPPRKFGPLQQLAIDLTTPGSLLLYLVVAALLIYGAVSNSWGALSIALLFVLFFGRGFVRNVRMMRHGVITTALIDEVHHEWGKHGSTDGVRVDEKLMNVAFELLPMRTLMGVAGGVEVQVVYSPHDRRPVGTAIAYRTPP